MYNLRVFYQLFGNSLDVSSLNWFQRCRMKKTRGCSIVTYIIVTLSLGSNVTSRPPLSCTMHYISYNHEKKYHKSLNLKSFYPTKSLEPRCFRWFCSLDPHQGFALDRLGDSTRPPDPLPKTCVPSNFKPRIRPWKLNCWFRCTHAYNIPTCYICK